MQGRRCICILLLFRARKNETKNVVVQCKAEDVEGYEGQKTIDDLLEVSKEF